MSEVPAGAGNPIQVPFGKVVDIVMEMHAGGFGCEEHPMHLHGQSFWLVGRGHGSWNSSLESTYNVVNPLYRDTDTFWPPPNSGYGVYVHGQSCGWITFRFRANNPGTWFFHCHIEWHVVEGFAVIFQTGADRLPALPPTTDTCGPIRFHNYTQVGQPTTPTTPSTGGCSGNSNGASTVNINFANLFNGLKV